MVYFNFFLESCVLYIKVGMLFFMGELMLVVKGFKNIVDWKYNE